MWEFPTPFAAKTFKQFLKKLDEKIVVLRLAWVIQNHSLASFWLLHSKINYSAKVAVTDVFFAMGVQNLVYF